MDPVSVFSSVLMFAGNQRPDWENSPQMGPNGGFIVSVRYVSLNGQRTRLTGDWGRNLAESRKSVAQMALLKELGRIPRNLDGLRSDVEAIMLRMDYEHQHRMQTAAKAVDDKAIKKQRKRKVKTLRVAIEEKSLQAANKSLPVSSMLPFSESIGTSKVAELTSRAVFLERLAKVKKCYQIKFDLGKTTKLEELLYDMVLELE